MWFVDLQYLCCIERNTSYYAFTLEKIYRKSLNNWTVCYVNLVQNSLLWKKGGKKHSKNKASFRPLRDRKSFKKFPDLTERGKSNDIAQRPIIQVFAVFIEIALESVSWEITRLIFPKPKHLCFEVLNVRRATAVVSSALPTSSATPRLVSTNLVHPV